MTEMVHGTMPAQRGEPVLSRWWRTVDRWTISSVLLLVGVGLLLALASSPPLASRNHMPAFYYFERHTAYAMLSVTVMLFVSMRSPETIRRWAVLGFGVGFLTLLALPVIGTDFGKGATRWLSLGFTSIQPSEFVKPCLAVTAGWLMAAGQDLNGPPGRALSLAMVLSTVFLLVLQPDPREFEVATLIPVAGGFFYALGAIATNTLCARESTVSLLMGMMLALGLFGLLGLAGIAVLGPESAPGPEGFVTRGWVWPMWQAAPWVMVQAAGSVVAVFMMTKGYQLGEPSYVGVFEYSLMIFGPLFAWVALGQGVGPWQVLGITLIALAGGIIAVRSK